jgi:NHL repeat-containing protein
MHKNVKKARIGCGQESKWEILIKLASKTNFGKIKHPVFFMNVHRVNWKMKKKILLLLPLFLAGRLLAQPAISTQPTNQVVLNGSNVFFNVAVSGTGPFTYQWQFNGTNLPSNIISTVAGNGTKGYSGDGGLATSAALKTPSAVAFDASGNLFIADTGNNRIRKVDAFGIITTVAGNGTNGLSGDGAAAINAKMSGPSDVTLDANGNLFIADTGNNFIRKVNTNGIITTIAGKTGSVSTGMAASPPTPL